jgi:PncC family amidohydrolase
MADPGLRPLAERLQEICLAAGLTVATAESCTGGRIADALTDVAGSSGYLRGGVVAYADAIKRELLGVPALVIEQHGAVSAQAARAMAAGARARLGVDLAVAVTGIAGPTGATPGKSVGLAYVAVADPAGIEIRRFTWSGGREANKAASANAALELLVERATVIAAGAAGGAQQADPAGTAGAAGGVRAEDPAGGAAAGSAD